MRVRRRLPSILVLFPVVLLSACGGGAAESSNEKPTSLDSSAVSVDTEPIESTTTVVAESVSARDLIPEPTVSTVDELLALDRPIVLAHASGEEESPHSSMYGYISAAIAGVDVLDLDVRLTADGVLVVHHDDDTGRTANADLVVHEETPTTYEHSTMLISSPRRAHVPTSLMMPTCGVVCAPVRSRRRRDSRPTISPSRRSKRCCRRSRVGY